MSAHSAPAAALCSPWAAAVRTAAAVVIAMMAVVAMMIATQVVVTRFLPQSSVIYLSATLVLALLYHFIGGQIGASIGRDSRPAAGLLVLTGALLMIGSVRHTWPTVAPWYSIAMLIAAPAGLALGYRAHARRRRWGPRQSA